MKKSLILVNPYFKLPSFLNQPLRLKEELIKLGVETTIASTGIDTVMIRNNRVENYVNQYDFVIYLDKDKYTSKLLECAGMRLFNPHEAVEVCDDKMETCIRLTNHGIDMPDTIPGLLCFTKEASITEIRERVDLIERRLGLPCIVKECYGSLGAGVYKVGTREALIDCMERIKYKPHMFQEMIVSSYGRDVRVIVIGGKAAGAMERSSKTDFRSNIELGGAATPFELPDSFRTAAEKCAKVLGLDYCGVDLLFGEDGKPLVCEVNSNAFFGGMEKVTGINIAEIYAKHMYETMYPV